MYKIELNSTNATEIDFSESIAQYVIEHASGDKIKDFQVLSIYNTVYGTSGVLIPVYAACIIITFDTVMLVKEDDAYSGALQDFVFDDVENRVIINTTDTSRYEKTHITSETHSCIEIENIRNTNHMNINDFENGVFLISKSEVNSTEIMFSFRGNDTFYFIHPKDKSSSYCSNGFNFVERGYAAISGSTKITFNGKVYVK